ncbi:hypothetical protein LEP1GSC043_4349 [Leptospira weilii str. Ecochallenge]|uniref:Uncharacterized protein n=1 Tax=Leptospira weilii str. Ecochallenge TaxID=1049986 RepID=N1UJ07_9LEPT|nr:hypothetical protein LEP1GSC043_4349 [Leptospira weilii str. Ecochallenge]
MHEGENFYKTISLSRFLDRLSQSFVFLIPRFLQDSRWDNPLLEKAVNSLDRSVFVFSSSIV